MVYYNDQPCTNQDALSVNAIGKFHNDQKPILYRTAQSGAEITMQYVLKTLQEIMPTCGCTFCSEHLLTHAGKGCLEFLQVIRRIFVDEPI